MIVCHSICSTTIEVSFFFQIPKLNNINDNERFLAMLNEFSFVNCDTTVEIHGVTLHPLALVMEYLPMGSLDKYLQSHKNEVKQVSNWLLSICY